MRLGVVVGLDAEARCLKPLPDAWIVQAVAGDGARARAAVREMSTAGCDGVASFGLAGGLSDRLRPGDAVIPREIVGGQQRWQTARIPSDLLIAALKGTVPISLGAIAGRDDPVLEPEEKARLASESDAVAVDMESHHVAAAAAELGLWMVCLRVVGDPAARAIPKAALAGMGKDGELRPAAVFRALLARPGDIPPMLRLALDTRQAFASLRRAAKALCTLSEVESKD